MEKGNHVLSSLTGQSRDEKKKKILNEKNAITYFQHYFPPF